MISAALKRCFRGSSAMTGGSSAMTGAPCKCTATLIMDCVRPFLGQETGNLFGVAYLGKNRRGGCLPWSGCRDTSHHFALGFIYLLIRSYTSILNTPYNLMLTVDNHLKEVQPLLDKDQVKSEEPVGVIEKYDLETDFQGYSVRMSERYAHCYDIYYHISCIFFNVYFLFFLTSEC